MATSSKENIAAIDLGSNSFHMVIASHENAEINIIGRVKEKIQLGKGLTAENRLSEAAMNKAFDCLQRFNDRLKAHNVTRVKAVGTNTLRVAKNKNDFLSQARVIFDHPIDIIAGKEEARLIYTGVRKSGICKDKVLVIDIGGGSTEIILGLDKQIKALDSLHMGCVSYQSRFFPNDGITEACFQAAETAAGLELLPIIEQYHRIKWHTAIGCSGTIQSILQVINNKKSLQNRITLEDLESIKRYLISVGHNDRIELPNLGDDRKNILPSGLAILIALFKNLGIEELKVSDAALREGLLFEMIDAQNNTAIRESTINRMLKLCHVDIKHAHRVQQTALYCLEQVEDAWDLGNEENKNLLSLAALVHEIGLVISFNQVHKHSAYILYNADLHGFTQQQKALLSVIVRGYRRKFPAMQFESIPLEHRLSCQRLCRLLRLSVLLNHQRREESIEQFQLVADHHRLQIILDKTLCAANSLLIADLNQEKQIMENAGYELVISTTRHCVAAGTSS